MGRSAPCAARARCLQRKTAQGVQSVWTAGRDQGCRPLSRHRLACLGDKLLQGLQPEARRTPGLPRQRPGRIVGRFKQGRPPEAHQLQRDGMLSAPAPIRML
jgi:hypothetical protein